MTRKLLKIILQCWYLIFELPIILRVNQAAQRVIFHQQSIQPMYFRQYLRYINNYDRYSHIASVFQFRKLPTSIR